MRDMHLSITTAYDESTEELKVSFKCVQLSVICMESSSGESMTARVNKNNNQLWEISEQIVQRYDGRLTKDDSLSGKLLNMNFTMKM